jgi:hypothetical protein
LAAEVAIVTLTDSESERRRSRRVHLPDTHGQLVVSLDGRVLDISIAGVAIETNSRLAPQHRIALRLHRGDELLTLQGRVVWCFLQGTRSANRGESVPVYRAGIEFSDVLTDSSRDLLGFLESNAAVTLETRIFGRFRLEDSAVQVASTVEFEVATINLQGMAVHTRLALETPARCSVELQIDPRPFECEARLLSSRPLPGAPETFEIALAFEDLTPGQTERLRALIRRELEAAGAGD